MLLLASTVTSSVSVERFLDQTIAGRGALPSLADVQRAAVETLGVTSDSDARSWASRARWKGVVPRVDALVGNTDTIGIRDSWSRVVAHATTEGQRLGVDVRARWELGELVFNDLELRANRETLSRAAAIQLARDRATRIYFDRVEVLLQQRQEPTPALALTAARLDGLLRAVTGGKLDRRSSEVSP
jgi:hypothetical protein